MTDAIELLGRDHAEARRLLAALETGLPAMETGVGGGVGISGVGISGVGISGGVGVGGGGAERLNVIVEQLIIEESGHESIEEQYFWPLVRRRVHDGERLADQAISQEQEAKHVLYLLEKHGPERPAFEALVRQFITIGRAHIDFEENQVWPGVRLALSEQELDELGDQLEQGKRLAPTRPHPNMPPTPEVLKVAAPIAGATDWIRDVLAGRRSR